MTSQVFPADQLTDLTATIFKAVGCNDNEADVIAKRLVNANLSGHDSHGIIRIAKYVDWIEQGGAVSAQAPKNRQSVTAALRLIDPVHGITPHRYPELV